MKTILYFLVDLIFVCTLTAFIVLGLAYGFACVDPTNPELNSYFLYSTALCMLGGALNVWWLNRLIDYSVRRTLAPMFELAEALGY
jgi:hypothetical protein